MTRTVDAMPERLVRGVDRVLRRLNRITEFTDDPGCIFRLSVGHARRNARLPDGTQIHRGDSVGMLHIWAEHVPPLPASGADFAWGAAVVRSARRSLLLLADHVARTPRMDSLAAFGNDRLFLQGRNSSHVLERIGFSVCPVTDPASGWERLKLTVVRHWSSLLRKAFNRNSVRSVRPADLHCHTIWVTRDSLLRISRPAPRPSTRVLT